MGWSPENGSGALEGTMGPGGLPTSGSFYRLCVTRARARPSQTPAVRNPRLPYLGDADAKAEAAVRNPLGSCESAAPGNTDAKAGPDSA